MPTSLAAVAVVEHVSVPVAFAPWLDGEYDTAALVGWTPVRFGAVPKTVEV